MASIILIILFPFHFSDLPVNYNTDHRIFAILLYMDKYISIEVKNTK